MKHLFIIIILSSTLQLFSQNPGMKELREKNIGWEHLMQPKGNVGNTSVIEGRTYSSNQLSLIETFSTWLKSSYVPIGGLPQFEKYVFPRKNEYIPVGTGVFLWAWDPAYDATGSTIVKSQPASAAVMGINANFLPGRQSADWFNTATANYFTMPEADYHFMGESKFHQLCAEKANRLGTSYKNYIAYNWGGMAVIILSPDNKLPILPVSRKELLDACEAGINKAFTNKKLTEALYNEEMKALKMWREKYKNELDQPATIKEAQLTPYSFNPDWDLFQPTSPADKTLYTVYKFDPAVISETAAGKVKWITITFPYANESSKTCGKEVYRAMTTHLNLEYIYNYFFNPGKAKGIAYQPLKADLLQLNALKYAKVNP